MQLKLTSIINPNPTETLRMEETFRVLIKCCFFKVLVPPCRELFSFMSVTPMKTTLCNGHRKSQRYLRD